MTRLLRCDVPGGIYHVANRGIARRAILETDRERRFFLSLLARGVRKTWIRVHAYCLMTNHYHLLVTSEGHLSTFMQWATSWFVRRYNHRRRRDGPLFRGRFWARRVGGEADFRNVVRYIHQNPVAAGLASEANDFPWSSAHHHSRRSRRPLWLCRDEVERVAPEMGFPPPSASIAWWIERRLDQGFDEDARAAVELGPGVSQEDVITWLERGCATDRRPTRPPVVALPALLVELQRLRAQVTSLVQLADGRVGDAWDALTCGLVHTGCGLSDPEIGDLTGASVKTVRGARARHARLLERATGYAVYASRVILAARQATLRE